MMTAIVTTKQVSKSLPNLFRVFINGKEVSVISHPAKNTYLKDKSLAELAAIEAKRILE